MGNPIITSNVEKDEEDVSLAEQMAKWDLVRATSTPTNTHNAINHVDYRNLSIFNNAGRTTQINISSDDDEDTEEDNTNWWTAEPVDRDRMLQLATPNDVEMRRSFNINNWDDDVSPLTTYLRGRRQRNPRLTFMEILQRARANGTITREQERAEAHFFNGRHYLPNILMPNPSIIPQHIRTAPPSRFIRYEESRGIERAIAALDEELLIRQQR